MTDQTGSSRVRFNDAQFAITRPKDGSVAASKAPKEVRYNSNGETDERAKKKFADNETCAVEITAGKEKIYKVKSKRGGALFNPLRTGFDYGLDRTDKVKNQPMFKFREVNAAAFSNYVKFLQKRHDSLLLAAEREA